MFLRIFACLLLLPTLAFAVTVEVVKLYQPLSFHNTDGAGDEAEGGEPIQAAVMARPYAITGAIPEDLVKAVAAPYQIASNATGYDVKDANLLNLCKVTMSVEMKGAKLLVRFNVSNLEIPEDLDLVARHVVRLSIAAIRRTLRDYFKGIEDEEAFQVSIAVTGTNEGNATLKDLAVRFKVGE
jgi:hypothetical protein